MRLIRIGHELEETGGIRCGFGLEILEIGVFGECRGCAKYMKTQLISSPSEEVYKGYERGKEDRRNIIDVTYCFKHYHSCSSTCLNVGLV